MIGLTHIICIAILLTSASEGFQKVNALRTMSRSDGHMFGGMVPRPVLPVRHQVKVLQADPGCKRMGG